MPTWKEASEKGFAFEDFILVDINNKVFPLAYKNTKKEEYKLYDILLFNGNFGENIKKVECKFDEKAFTTGNIIIETECNGRLSGLLVTEAHHWIITDGETVYIIEKQKIYDCIIDNKLELKTKDVSQGDGSTKKMKYYLAEKKHIFAPYCCEISNINEIKYDCLK